MPNTLYLKTPNGTGLMKDVKGTKDSVYWHAHIVYVDGRMVKNKLRDIPSDEPILTEGPPGHWS